MRPHTLKFVAVSLAAAAVLASVRPTAGQKADSLRVLGDQYPQAFFFRAAEGFAANPRWTYGRWEACFERLMGIEGKVLEEEVQGRSARNIDFFTRFKRRHPDQLVLLHYNGNARDPRYQIGDYFAGHFLYYNGATILGQVPAEEGETDIKVDDATLFRTEMGRYRWSNEDVGLCVLDGQGNPDWNTSEQVQLVSVDRRAKVIRVKRGCFGTRPRAFPAGKSYAAAHVTEGPWGRKSNLLWYYNYATVCPRDGEGRTCGDVHAAELARRFSAQGELAAFDGLEFDVLHHETGHGGRRAPDCNADGKPDAGIVDGRNVYGVGVVEFCRRLRAGMGPDRLILADGMGLRSQRAFEILNGIESEGWPVLSDWKIRDWSGGLNRHFFWAANAHQPVFNYINHKFVTHGEEPGAVQQPDVPWNIHRLVFAVAMFTDSAVCYSFAPPREPPEQYGIWDELRQGTEHEIGWLGKPMGPPVRMALREPATASAKAGELVPERGEGDATRFVFRDVRCDGPDLFVQVTMQGEPREGYPREIARMAWVGIAPSVRNMTFVGDRPFTSTFYFSEVRSKTVDLKIEVEGREPVRVEAMSAHPHPDAIYRQFEHGLVLANPSPRPYTFDLDGLLPGQKYCRLQGSPHQDPTTNDGSAVEGSVTLGPKDALFLVKVR